VYVAHVYVTLKPGILDPQGKTVHHALGALDFTQIRDVRFGKYIQMTIEAQEAEQAAQVVRSACEKLLANPVVETYRFDLEEQAEG
jgi:phosphoribosylformylglycinamidine synthase PurS subunit